MLLPLSIAIIILVALGLTIYAFRIAIVRWIGRTKRQARSDMQEIQEVYQNELERRDRL